VNRPGSRSVKAAVDDSNINVYDYLMPLIHDIRVKVSLRQYEFSKHAVDQAIIRKISVAELEEAISNEVL